MQKLMAPVVSKELSDEERKSYNLGDGLPSGWPHFITLVVHGSMPRATNSMMSGSGPEQKSCKKEMVQQ